MHNANLYEQWWFDSSQCHVCVGHGSPHSPLFHPWFFPDSWFAVNVFTLLQIAAFSSRPRHTQTFFACAPLQTAWTEAVWRWVKMRLLRISRLRTAKKRQIPGRPKSLALRACHPFHSIPNSIDRAGTGTGWKNAEAFYGFAFWSLKFWVLSFD